MTTTRTAILGLVGLFMVFVFLPASASAKVTGPCTATIGGVDLTQEDSVHVQQGSDVDYAFSAPSPVAAYNLQLRYGPYEATPSQGVVEDAQQTSISGTVPLSDYAWLGVGVYELEGNVMLTDGTSCVGSMKVYVDGDPLTTAIGATAAVVTASSTIGLVLLFLKDAGLLFGGP
jgi:hypothetical protein